MHYALDREFWIRAGRQFSLVHFAAHIADMRAHASAKTVSQAVRLHLEVESVLDEFFASPNLTPELKAMESEARGATLFAIGHEYLKTKQHRQARQAFARAWRTYPLNVNKLIIPAFWFDSVFRTNASKPVFRLAVWLKHRIWLPA